MMKKSMNKERYYVVYWRMPGRKDALWGMVLAESEERAYEITRIRLRHDCRITAIYKAACDPVPSDLCINFAAPTVELFG